MRNNFYKLTPAQRQKVIRAYHLQDFRRYITFEGPGDISTMNAWEMREYVESQWLEGMNWDNYGDVWVVDHIVPLKYFDARAEKEMKICWNYNNLKPSYRLDNHAKGYCLEVTMKILDSRPSNPMVFVLKEWLQEKQTMFNKYYV